MVFIKKLNPRIFVQCNCCYTDWSLAFYGEGCGFESTPWDWKKFLPFFSFTCPYCSRQFSAILAASQPYFVDILFIRINLKGGSKRFSLQSALFSSCRSLTKKSTKKLCSSSLVYFVRKNALSRSLYCF